MKQFFLIMAILIYSINSQAAKSTKGLIGSIGLTGLGGVEADAETTNGKKVFDADGTLGYTAGIEYPMLKNFLTINANIFYGKWQGKSQYNDVNSGIQATDQESSLSLTTALLGARIRPINFKHWRIFVGGGGMFGTAKLRHDKANYEENHGTAPSSFKEVEKVNASGHYLEAGTEFIFSNVSGIRLTAQQVSMDTQKFKTLDKSIRSNFFTGSIQYIHYFDKLFK